MPALNDEINAARDTTKTNTLRVETFKAPELGLLGYIDEDKISFYRTPTKRHSAQSEFDITSLTQLPKVTILYSYIDPDASLIDAAIKGGAKGVVFAGTGWNKLMHLPQIVQNFRSREQVLAWVNRVFDQEFVEIPGQQPANTPLVHAPRDEESDMPAVHVAWGPRAASGAKSRVPEAQVLAKANLADHDAAPAPDGPVGSREQQG